MTVTIENKRGEDNRNEFVRAVAELTEALAGNGCREFTWKSGGENAYVVSFEEAPGLGRSDVREAVKEFNEGNWGMVCTLGDGSFAASNGARPTFFDRVAGALNRAFGLA